MSERSSNNAAIAVAAAKALATWWTLSIGGAILLHSMWGPSGEDPPIEGALVVVYYAVALFEVPGLVFAPTVVASIVPAAEAPRTFESLGFSISVGLVNGFCWACLVAIGRASLRRRRREIAMAAEATSPSA